MTERKEWLQQSLGAKDEVIEEAKGQHFCELYALVQLRQEIYKLKYRRLVA